MISAALVAEHLGLPAPTSDQCAVIEAPLEPALVVAGAGSGKTETMAARVIWLVANGLVQPSEVLGLTFTRKAAGELSERILRRIGQLNRSGLLAERLDPLEIPVVTTYNAFANGMFRDHAHRIGREADAGVLSEAASWLLARKTVLAADDGRLADLDKSPEVLTEAVLRLARALPENRADAQEVKDFADEFRGLADRPRGGRGAGVMRDVAAAIESVDALPVLLNLAASYSEAKRRRGSVEFSDQVAFANDILDADPSVTAEYRDRYRVVLLDEYQDTSIAQTRLLAGLFRDHPVMAVGDPHQSIYGWRGASAANLARFPFDFAQSTVAGRFSLSTSWRNPRRVLALANQIVSPFGGAAVNALTEKPGALEGTVEIAFPETVAEEAVELARWFADRLLGPGAPRSAAILCRSLKQSEPFTAALRDAGVPFRVLGIGGLLEQPAVADLLCTLRVLRHADANAELVRLLTGARWRIGVSDVDGLARVAAWLVTRDHARRALAPELVDSVRSSVAEDEQRSLVDALDFLVTAPDDHRHLNRISPEGRQRMREFGRELSALRAHGGHDLLEQVVEVERTLLLDIEVRARTDHRSARDALDAFETQVVGFQADDPTADLGAFLTWIAEAERRDSLSPRSDEPEAGVVQILTIHGAKGLEWDVVAVPRMVDGEMPSDPRTTRGWLGFGELPYSFRADGAELPILGWRSCDTQQEFVRSLEEFKAAERVRQRDEERRLAYVAVTRARSELLLTGSFWSRQVAPRMPSVFLREAEQAGILNRSLPVEPGCESNPLDTGPTLTLWPRDPLAGRGEHVRRAAALVRSADPSAVTEWDDLIELLLAERSVGQHGEAELPTRVAASHFKDFIDDADRVLQARKRPMPQRPLRQTRLGTEFHSWVEARFSAGTPSLSLAGVDVDGADTHEADQLDFDHTDDDELWNAASFYKDSEGGDRERRLHELRERFASSPWGTREAEDVELELHLPLGDRIVVCKLDAVFRVGDRYEIVDWKTGARPKGERDLELRQYQLSLYRLAYAKWKGVALESIDALYYFVADDLVVAPPRLLDETALLERWESMRAELFSPR